VGNDRTERPWAADNRPFVVARGIEDNRLAGAEAEAVAVEEVDLQRVVKDERRQGSRDVLPTRQQRLKDPSVVPTNFVLMVPL